METGLELAHLFPQPGELAIGNFHSLVISNSVINCNKKSFFCFILPSYLYVSKGVESVCFFSLAFAFATVLFTQFSIVFTEALNVNTFATSANRSKKNVES